ncbi:unnamed protein product, partial [Durusdinium trenchii]
QIRGQLGELEEANRALINFLNAPCRGFLHGMCTFRRCTTDAYQRSGQRLEVEEYITTSEFAAGLANACVVA